MSMNRRSFLLTASATAVTSVATGCGPTTNDSSADGPAAHLDIVCDPERLQAVLERYQAFGIKRSGGEGDNDVGFWLEAELQRLGYDTGRQHFAAPLFDTDEATISLESGHSATVLPQSVVVPTPAGGLTAPLAVRRDATDDGGLRGAIVLAVFGFRRWGDTNQIADDLRSIADAGAAAVLVVTTGFSGEAQALNAPADAPLVDIPVAILAPRDAAPFIEAAGGSEAARLVVSGRHTEADAFNVVGRLDRGNARWIVVSTPRSGWFVCAGERGPGIAVWTALADLLRDGAPDHDLMFVCTSGHEHHNLGSAAFIEHGAPRPADTDLWAHVGGNLATHDWHETPSGLLPLPSVDPQRYVLAADRLVPVMGAAFEGLPGLERPYPASIGAIGEFVEILDAGYTSSMAAFSVSRIHHTAIDVLPITSGELVSPVVRAFYHAIVGATDRT